MTTLTEQFKQGKLETYKRYYCKNVWFEDIFMARCHNEGQNDEWWTLENERYSYNNIHHIKDIEVLDEVPSYDKWKGLNKRLSDTQKLELEVRRENAELKETISNDIFLIRSRDSEIVKLKELLKLAKESVSYHCALCREYTDGQVLLDKINQVLQENNDA